MRRNSYIIKVPIMAIIVGLILAQLQLLCAVIEAKHYNQPYGDIMLEENEYQNSFNARNAPNGYENNRNGQRLGNNYQQPDGYAENYQNEYANMPGSGRRRGEREKSQNPQTIDNTYYNRNNRNLGRNNPNGWMVSSSIVEEQQNSNISMENNEHALQHKCHIWVP